MVGQRWSQLPLDERLRYADRMAGHKRQAGGNAIDWEPAGIAAAAGAFPSSSLG